MIENFIMSLYYASAFFFVIVLFAFTGASAVVATGFLDAVLFNLALIAFLFLELPYEPLATFPLLDFLSPFPIQFKTLRGQL